MGLITNSMQYQITIDNYYYYYSCMMIEIIEPCQNQIILAPASLAEEATLAVAASDAVSLAMPHAHVRTHAGAKAAGTCSPHRDSRCSCGCKCRPADNIWSESGAACGSDLRHVDRHVGRDVVPPRNIMWCQLRRRCQPPSFPWELV